MLTDGLVYASLASGRAGLEDGSLVQVANVASLPGIVGPALGLPDLHLGYGFPIGGVAAFDAEEGVVSPGGVGYDINCGVRLYRTGVPLGEVRQHLGEVLDSIARRVPAGVGAGQGPRGLGDRELQRVLEEGAAWAVRKGSGDQGELERIEDGGCLKADPSLVSARALARGRGQLGTLGSGNHFVEIGQVVEIFDDDLGADFGLVKGEMTVLIHSGSRGLGHQVCDESIRALAQAAGRHRIRLPDRQLVCAPVRSEEGRRYMGAMAAAANFAFANRQVIGNAVREALEETLRLGPRDLSMELVYDVCHNIAKLEEHVWEGRPRQLCVHRKGATRALPPGDPRLPDCYLRSGQPVLVPGDMGRASYVLAGRPGAAETFFSACHGAGRLLSRQGALRAARGRQVISELEARGVVVRAARRATLMEEMPEAYRDVSEVVEVVVGAGLATRVARLEPAAVLKG
ncbi:MAG: RtcB family protein [Polyangia bacterium]|nr:RtcB family protein [Polyangia bacterium]